MGAGVGVEHDGRRLAADLAQHLRDRARVLAVGGDDEPAGVAVAVRAHVAASRSWASARIRGRPSSSSVEIAVR